MAGPHQLLELEGDAGGPTDELEDALACGVTSRPIPSPGSTAILYVAMSDRRSTRSVSVGVRGQRGGVRREPRGASTYTAGGSGR
jgi:hypothetical protein